MTTDLNQRLGDNEMDNSEIPHADAEVLISLSKDELLNMQNSIGDVSEEIREKMDAIQLAALIVNKKIPNEPDEVRIKATADLGQNFGDALRAMNRWLRGQAQNTLGKAAAL